MRTEEGRPVAFSARPHVLAAGSPQGVPEVAGLDGRFEGGPVEPDVAVGRDPHEAAQARVGPGHDPQEPFDLVGVGDQLGPDGLSAAAVADAHCLAVSQVARPAAPGLSRSP